jgi:aldose 1-epimerase
MSTTEADTRPPSAAPAGREWRISHGDQHADVAEVGAAIRSYRVGGRDVFQSPGEDFSPAFHGAVLLPWPNRLRDGRYSFSGLDYQVAITEPERMTALHGLSAWRSWSLVAHDPNRIELSLRLLPSPGYPFHLDTRIAYSLDDDGLRVTATSTNVGNATLPYGLAFHPYLSGGGSLLDECALRIDAGERFVTDDRLLPTGTEDVSGTDFDFRIPRTIGSTRLDTAFAGLPRDSSGRAWICLTGPDGRTAAVWSEPTCPYWQVYTGDTLSPALFRRGLAAEPMTAAPDAFNNGLGLIALAPGDTVTTTWGAALLCIGD